jgi:hypothetical protein
LQSQVDAVGFIWRNLKNTTVEEKDGLKGWNARAEKGLQTTLVVPKLHEK